MAGVDSMRVGLNRAYDLKETRSFWALCPKRALRHRRGGRSAGLLAADRLWARVPASLDLCAGIRGSLRDPRSAALSDRHPASHRRLAALPSRAAGQAAHHLARSCPACCSPSSCGLSWPVPFRLSRPLQLLCLDLCFVVGTLRGDVLPLSRSARPDLRRRGEPRPASPRATLAIQPR